MTGYFNSKIISLILILLTCLLTFTCKHPDSILDDPDIAETVYIGSGDGRLYALDAILGSKKWSFATGDAVFSSPTLVNGIVYVANQDGILYAIDAVTGLKKWNFTTEGFIDYQSPTVANGIVYIGGTDGKLYAINAVTGVKI